jgi:hypothetical protein
MATKCQDCAFMDRKDTHTICVRDDTPPGIFKDVHPLYAACEQFVPKHLKDVPLYKSERLF